MPRARSVSDSGIVRSLRPRSATWSSPRRQAAMAISSNPLRHGMFICFSSQDVAEAQRIVEYLESQAAAAPDAPVSDITREAPDFPSPRDARLQTLARGDEGFLLGLAYSTQRGYGPHLSLRRGDKVRGGRGGAVRRGPRLRRPARRRQRDRMPDGQPVLRPRRKRAALHPRLSSCPPLRPALADRSDFAVRKPKNRWPFQFVPVIALATCDRLP